MEYWKLTKEELIHRLEEAEERRRKLEDRRESAVENEQLRDLRTHQVELEVQNQTLREAQGLIEDSRCRYVDLYDFAPIPYCTFDRNGFVLEMNLTGAAILGKERSWILKKPFLDLVRVDNPKSFLSHIRESLESMVPITGELSFSTDRGPLAFQIVSAAISNPRGSAVACRTAFLDITQRRLAEGDARRTHQAEKVLRDRLERIEHASAAVSAALATLSGADISGFLQVAVDQARSVIRAEYAALGIGGGSGRPFSPWVYSGMSAELAAAIGRAPRGVGLLGVVIHAGRAVRLRDLREHGSYTGLPLHHPKLTSFLGVPIQYQGETRGNLYLVNKEGGEEFTEEDQIVLEVLSDRVGVAMEIARLRQAEARERVKLEFRANAGALLAESIDYETTLDAIARLVVPAAADLSAVDLLQDDGAIKEIAVFHPDPEKQKLVDQLRGITWPSRISEDIRAAIETAQPQRRELTVEFLRDGIPNPLHGEILRQIGAKCTIVAPLIVRGRVIGTLRLVMAESGRRYTDEDLSLAQEIAHHAALAIESARLYRAAQNAIRARDNLLAVASHDLRNYLATIRVSAEQLSRAASADGRTGPKPVEAIKRSAARMDQLIESLVDTTMIETGDFTIAPKIEDVTALVEEALDVLAPQSEARSLRLNVQLDDHLPAVCCDRERVLQVITNLVGNSIKFTEKGGEILIDARPVGSEVCFTVSDTGRGIPEEQIARVFDRYWKGRKDTRAGTGLGLCIAKGIVEAHGGRIWVESKVGTGSSFFFTLPSESQGCCPPSSRIVRAKERPPPTYLLETIDETKP
jgi:signal transduction histidine kinase/PAS domain-containing protein